MGSQAAAAEPAFKEIVKTFDGRTVDATEVADCFDPDCDLGCDLGLLSRMVPLKKGSRALVPTTNVCSCAINSWQKKNPKEATRGS